MGNKIDKSAWFNIREKWTKNLPCLRLFRLFMDNILEQNEACNATFYYDTEAFFEKLLKMAKKLREKNLFNKRDIKNLCNCKAVTFIILRKFVFFCFTFFKNLF